MRTFVAIEINNEDLLNSVKSVQNELKLNAKPVDLQNIHFTMMFLGEITEQISKKVQDALQSVKFSPFNVEFVGIGAFPKPRFPRVVWIGTRKGADKLSELAVKIEKALLPLGFKNDKKFKAHVTIFRIKNKIGDISDKLAGFNSTIGIQHVSEIKFKKSVLTSNGPIYSDLQVIKAE